MAYASMNMIVDLQPGFYQELSRCIRTSISQMTTNISLEIVQLLQRTDWLRFADLQRELATFLSTSGAATIRLFGEQTRSLVGDFEGYLGGWFEG